MASNFPPAVKTMKVTGLSWPRRYTCAAVNGLGAVTVPATAPVPRMVDSAARAGRIAIRDATTDRHATYRDFQRSRMGLSFGLRFPRDSQDDQCGALCGRSAWLL